MARPRSFDTDRALDDIRTAFWSRGVNGTSVADLCDATGLTTGSLYKAFVDKPTLVRRVLDDYLDAGLELTRATLDGGATPLGGITDWLELMASFASSDGPTRGCFAVQCASELAEREPDVRARLVAHDERLRRALADTLRRAREGGETAGDPDVQARVLTTLVNGLQLEARKGIAAEDARAVVDAALALVRVP